MSDLIPRLSLAQMPEKLAVTHGFIVNSLQLEPPDLPALKSTTV